MKEYIYLFDSIQIKYILTQILKLKFGKLVKSRELIKIKPKIDKKIIYLHFHSLYFGSLGTNGQYERFLFCLSYIDKSIL